MTEKELIDQILQVCKTHAAPVQIKAYLKKEYDYDQSSPEFKMAFTGALKTLRHHDLIVESDSTIASDLRITTSPKGHQLLENYGSYTSFIESNNKERHMQERINQLTIENLRLQNSQMKRYALYAIIGFVFGIIATNYREIFLLLKSFWSE